MEYTTAQRICFIVEHTAPSEWPNEAMFALKLVAKLYSWAVKMVRNPSVCKLNLNGAVVWKQESCIQRGSFIDQRSLQGMWSSFVLVSVDKSSGLPLLVRVDKSVNPYLKIELGDKLAPIYLCPMRLRIGGKSLNYS